MSMNSHPASAQQHPGPIPQSPHLSYRNVPLPYQPNANMINPMMMNATRPIGSLPNQLCNDQMPFFSSVSMHQTASYNGSYLAHGFGAPGSMGVMRPVAPAAPFKAQVEPIIETIQAKGKHEKDELITLQMDRVCYGSGAFGMVFRGKLTTELDPTPRQVAIKKVKQENKYRNRELPLLNQLSHQNVVRLYYHYFKQVGDNRDPGNKSLFLFLVMEFMPKDLNHLITRVRKQRNTPTEVAWNSLQIKVCMYQLFAALDYVHEQEICHRDIKPNNLLYDPNTLVLKLCDFGSAKKLVPDQTNVAYICARFYRAPELLFGAAKYTNKIDLWSTGVVFTELLQGEPLFHGDNGLDHLVLIMTKLGTPTRPELSALNKDYENFEFPFVPRKPLDTLFPQGTPLEALNLLDGLFQYDPKKRLSPLEAMRHSFFNELRNPNLTWTHSDGKQYKLPPLVGINDLKR